MFKVDEILRYLDTCEPYRVTREKTARQVKWGKWATTLQKASGMCLLVATLIVIWKVATHYAPEPLRLVALCLIVLCFGLGTASFIVLMMAGISGWNTARKSGNKRKINAVDIICGQVKTDEAHAQCLRSYPDNFLKYAQHCLQLKITRLESPISLVWGEKTSLV